MVKQPILPYNPKLVRRARYLRQNMTPGEVSLWQCLKKKQLLGYDFDRQRPIDQFIVDFYCKKLKLAIEIDGASHDGEAAQAKDRERQNRLETLGIYFLRFSEELARTRPQLISGEIKKWILQNSS